MKIRIKNNGNLEGLETNFVYEIDDEKGIKSEINVAYLESVIRLLKVASEKVTIRHGKSFEKFLVNLKRATRYYDKVKSKSSEYPNIIHIEQSMAEINELEGKAIKYDKKAQAMFSMHSGWYENLPLIIEEIKNIYDENRKELSSEVDVFYIASLIDSVLEKYRKKPKQKTL